MTFDEWYYAEIARVIEQDFNGPGDLYFLHDHKPACDRAWDAAVQSTVGEMEELRKEVERMKSDRAYTIGWNDGFEHAKGEEK